MPLLSCDQFANSKCFKGALERHLIDLAESGTRIFEHKLCQRLRRRRQAISAFVLIRTILTKEVRLIQPVGGGYLLYEIKRKLQRGEITISDGIVKCLPDLRGRVPDETLVWLASELQGYSNSLHFYQENNHNLPAYRVVKGTLKIMDASGKLTDIKHPFTSRTQFFLGAPVAWLEEFAKLPGEVALVELPDLTTLLGGGRGNVACEFTKEQLTRMLSIVKSRVLEVMNQVATKN